MTILERIVNWNKERKIPKNYNKEKEAGHIAEELSELLRANTYEEEVDAFADMIVYATGAIWKAGYNPEKIMEEVLKHIESRKGCWDSSIGKWVKEPSKVYQVDFKICKN